MHIFRNFAIAALVLFLSACSSLPSAVVRAPSTALEDTADTTELGRVAQPYLDEHPGRSGFHTLTEGAEAFAARIAMVDAAQRSLDLQYYIWHQDFTGQLLWEAVWKAAERGVRVRVLLDDQNTEGQDAMLAALDAHPNIKIRLFNPFSNRSFRIGDFTLDFLRVNRRMHNKSFTIDNQVTIIGGRNVGDEYYGASANVAFHDLDVLGVGPVVKEVSAEFDQYWNSDVVYPLSAVVAPVAGDGEAGLQASWIRVREDPRARTYLNAVRDTLVAHQMAAYELPLEWAVAHVVHDDPSKSRRTLDRSDLMIAHLEALMGHPRAELDLVSPYFVSGEEVTDTLIGFAKRGVKVHVLTNSLLATDVIPVHAGYSKYRVRLLQAGVRLHELKADSESSPRWNSTFPRTEEERYERRSGLGSRASSASSLHAKTFAVDRQRLFVGSFNLDPRSERLNTEMGVVIESPALAGEMSSLMDTALAGRAYEVRLQRDGHSLQWVDYTPEGQRIYAEEPGSSPVKRMWIKVLQVLPIEWLL